MQQQENAAMKRFAQSKPQFPVRDYSRALQNSLSWLGDRYLLATPISARGTDQQAERSGSETKPVFTRIR
jgi:hypothetical protein